MANHLNIRELNQLQCDSPRCHTRESGYLVAFSQRKSKMDSCFRRNDKKVSLARSRERLDLQILLDRLKKYLDLPAILDDACYSRRTKGKVICPETDYPFIFFVPDLYRRRYRGTWLNSLFLTRNGFFPRAGTPLGQQLNPFTLISAFVSLTALTKSWRENIYSRI